MVQPGFQAGNSSADAIPLLLPMITLHSRVESESSRTPSPPPNFECACRDRSEGTTTAGEMAATTKPNIAAQSTGKSCEATTKHRVHRHPEACISQARGPDWYVWEKRQSCESCPSHEPPLTAVHRNATGQKDNLLIKANHTSTVNTQPRQHRA